MVKLTQSLVQWLYISGNAKIAPLLMFGHLELLTEEMWEEYIEWCKTDEGKQYLEGGSKYEEKLNKW